MFLYNCTLTKQKKKTGKAGLFLVCAVDGTRTRNLPRDRRVL